MVLFVFCWQTRQATWWDWEQEEEKDIEINKRNETKCNLILITFISFDDCDYVSRLKSGWTEDESDVKKF